ncbi:hypothetical protein [Paenibacillus sp. V4I5]|uniref:hypothetical protein n=1 Tax=Paenibacillus sp. V4I5 TaxID=3042306 RepID=UPI0027D806C3|nr:hypothetical protein [Paenibacillus sp. V4I5]
MQLRKAADHGAYVLDGKAINQLKDAQLAEIRNRKIGFVFQSFNLLPRLNAYENVELPLIYRGMSKKERYPLVMHEILKRLNEQGRTIVLITHDLAIAQQAMRVVHFRDGRLCEVG